MKSSYFYIQCLVCLGLSLLFSLFFPNIDTTENSILEDMQAVVIALGMVLYGYRSVRVKERLMRMVNLGAMLLLFSFLIRELDVEEFASLPDMMRYYLGKEGKNLTMQLLWGSYFVLLFSGVDKIQYWYRRIRSSVELQWWISALILLVLSQLMDKNVLHLHHHLNRYYEEFWELFSYSCMLWAAWVGMRQTDQSAGI